MKTNIYCLIVLMVALLASCSAHIHKNHVGLAVNRQSGIISVKFDEIFLGQFDPGNCAVVINLFRYSNGKRKHVNCEYSSRWKRHGSGALLILDFEPEFLEAEIITVEVMNPSGEQISFIEKKLN